MLEWCSRDVVGGEFSATLVWPVVQAMAGGPMSRDGRGRAHQHLPRMPLAPGDPDRDAEDGSRLWWRQHITGGGRGR